MNAEFLSFSKIPVNFQKDLLEKVSVCIKKGESVQIVGIPGSGSSLIAKALTQNSGVQDKYFSDKYLFVQLDGGMLLEKNPLSMLRLFLSILFSGEIPNDGLEIYNQIESKAAEICTSRNLVLIIDHLDAINLSELLPFFSKLHKIHRVLEPKLSLIFITTSELKSPHELSNFGLLGRVLVQNILKIPKFNKSDTYWFIEEKEKQIGISLSEKEKKEIYKLSGGFPRTIKRLVESVGKGFSIADISQNPLIDPSLAHHLSDLENYDNINIVLFDNYKNAKEKVESSEIIGGIKFSKRLTKNEEKVLKALTSVKGEVVGRENVIEKIWGIRGIAISDHAYDQIIHRLRNKLKSASPKTDIETVKGRGHVLKY